METQNPTLNPTIYDIGYQIGNNNLGITGASY